MNWIRKLTTSRLLLLLIAACCALLLITFTSSTQWRMCQSAHACHEKRASQDSPPYGDLLSDLDTDFPGNNPEIEIIASRSSNHRGSRKSNVPHTDKDIDVQDWIRNVNDVTKLEQHQKQVDHREVSQPETTTRKQESESALNCSTLLSDDRLVRNCITSDVIGRVPRSVKTRLYEADEERDVFREIPGEDAKERAQSFQDIFKSRKWGHSWDPNQPGFNASGRGATIFWTQEAMAGLHVIITQLKQTLGKSRVKLLDMPCGDMAWMSRFLDTRSDIDYTGADVVPGLIDHHQKQYKDKPWKFIQLDIVQDLLKNDYDLIFTRTLLQHLYMKDVKSILQKISQSGSGYFLGTTFSREYYNAELELGPSNPGRFRRLNLEVPPLSLTPPLCLLRDGPAGDLEGWDHFLALWKLPLGQIVGCQEGKEFIMTGTDKVLYSCVEWSPYIDVT